MPIDQYKLFDNTVHEQFLLDFSKEWEKIKELQKFEEFNKKMKNIDLKYFKEKYCKTCGSQRCTSEGEWLNGCHYYKEYIKNI